MNWNSYRRGEQGQGSSTRLKEGLFFLPIGLILWRAARKISWEHNYLHVDLNCGSGQNTEAGCVGSPLAFLRAVAKYPDLGWRAAFIDNDVEKITQLKATVGSRFVTAPGCGDAGYGRRGVEFFCQDNAKFLREEFPVWLRERGGTSFRWAVGSLLCDPNGNKDGFPWRELGFASRLAPNFAVIFRYAWQAAKACACVNRNHPGRYASMPDVTTAKLMAEIPRRYWLIVNVCSARPSVVLVGNNYPLPGHPGTGLWPVGSQEGKALWEKLHSW